VQSLGLCFYPLLKCLKRFIVLLPDAAVRIADDECRGAGLSLSYDAIASRREYGFPNGVHHYKWTPSQPVPSPPFVTNDLPQFAHDSMFPGFGSTVACTTLPGSQVGHEPLHGHQTKFIGRSVGNHIVFAGFLSCGQNVPGERFEFHVRERAAVS
jgi:hypothetical protein